VLTVSFVAPDPTETLLLLRPPGLAWNDLSSEALSPYQGPDTKDAQMKRTLLLAVSAMLLSGSVAFAQQAPPPSQAPNSTIPRADLPDAERGTTGQSFRDDRLQSDRDSPVIPNPKNAPDPNPLPGEQPRPIPR
jgi:hypothetical protein